MAEVPEELFLDAVRALVTADRDWVPTRDGESLYLRPLEFALDPFLGVRPSREYQFLLFASPAGAYFTGGVRPVTVWLSTEYVRAAPGGTGEAKCAGNYAASLVAQAQAAEQGCDQVVWLDAVEHRYVEEMGGMNLYFVFADGRLVTPALTGSLLAGVTRDSILTLGKDLGLQVEERLISTDEWEAGCADGSISEVFACGTAAVVTPGRRGQARGRLVHGGRRGARGADDEGARGAAGHPAGHRARPARLDAAHRREPISPWWTSAVARGFARLGLRFVRVEGPLHRREEPR